MNTPLQEWANDNLADESLKFFNAAWQQVMFVRDRLPLYLASSEEAHNEIMHSIQVVGTHTSKHIELPVYKITAFAAVEIYMRANFYDWAISVASAREVVIDFHDLLKTDPSTRSIYFEGFERKWVFGPYKDNKKQFSFALKDQGKVEIFFFLLGAALGLREKVPVS